MGPVPALNTLKDRWFYLQTLKANIALDRSAPEKFPGELKAFDEVMGWLASFIEKLFYGQPTEIVHSLTMLGIDDPRNQNWWKHLSSGEPIDSWFELYHWQYNTAIWEVIVNLPWHIVPKMRKVLQRDLKAGKIADRDYEQALLDNFLKIKAPSWCIAPDSPESALISPDNWMFGYWQSSKAS